MPKVTALCLAVQKIYQKQIYQSSFAHSFIDIFHAESQRLQVCTVYTVESPAYAFVNSFTKAHFSLAGNVHLSRFVVILTPAPAQPYLLLVQANDSHHLVQRRDGNVQFRHIRTSDHRQNVLKAVAINPKI